MEERIVHNLPGRHPHWGAQRGCQTSSKKIRWRVTQMLSQPRGLLQDKAKRKTKRFIYRDGAVQGAPRNFNAGVSQIWALIGEMVHSCPSNLDALERFPTNLFMPRPRVVPRQPLRRHACGRKPGKKAMTWRRSLRNALLAPLRRVGFGRCMFAKMKTFKPITAQLSLSVGSNTSRMQLRCQESLANAGELSC